MPGFSVSVPTLSVSPLLSCISFFYPPRPLLSRICPPSCPLLLSLPVSLPFTLSGLPSLTSSLLSLLPSLLLSSPLRCLSGFVTGNHRLTRRTIRRGRDSGDSLAAVRLLLSGLPCLFWHPGHRVPGLPLAFRTRSFSFCCQELRQPILGSRPGQSYASLPHHRPPSPAREWGPGTQGNPSARKHWSELRCARCWPKHASLPFRRKRQKAWNSLCMEGPRSGAPGTWPLGPPGT